LYYDFTAQRLEGTTLVKKAFSTQNEHADYHPKLHFLGFPGYIAYVFPDKFTQAALDGFKRRLRTFQGDEFIARIDRRGQRFRYARITGDPLNLAGTVDRLNRLGKADSQQFYHETDWWKATTKHAYPDPLRRIWEGLHDLVQHSGTLLVSLKDGYAFGPRIFSQSIIHPRAGTHGALLANHSYGFLMTDFMPVKPASRPADVAGLLARSAEAKQSGQKLQAATQN
jgi:hypothetical protein